MQEDRPPDGFDATGDEVDRDSETDRRPEGRTGKPYRWQLQAPELIELFAFPPADLVDPLNRAVAFHRRTVVRTAAFLVVISRNNGYEGRDPTLVYDDVKCGTVADLLGFDIVALTSALLDLQSQGLVDCGSQDGLRLKDIDTLDRISEGC